MSTEVCKVAEDLRPYTCDALAGVEPHASDAAQREAQYRMHAMLARFSAEAFYEGRLRTVVECAAREDLDGKSKKNPGQAALCRTVCALLLSTPPPPTPPSAAPPPASDPFSMAVLTPYTGQATLLRAALAGLAGVGTVEVASVDGFQGREADVVVFVTVRCNARGETGFLRDPRRLNVALTRARTGLVVLGHRRTLTGRGDGVGDGDE